MKRAAVLVLSALAAVMFTGSSPAHADGYDVICVTQTLPGGKPLPEVCVPIIVSLP